MRRLFILLLLGLCPWLARADTSPATNIHQPQASPTIFSRVRDLFDIDLPDLDPPGTVKFILRPHVSDFVRRDYLRTEVGLRWAVNDQFELSSEVSTYLDHGFGGGDPGSGFGEFRGGAKYLLPTWFQPNWETSVSFNASVPVGHPPIDMTDGLNHYSPGLVVQHHWISQPKLTTFAGTSLDFVTVSSVPGEVHPNMPRDDSVSFTLGGIYDLGQLKWTLSGTYATTALLGDETANFYYLRPSLQWYVPRKFTFHSKTQWIVGFGTPLTWGPDGFDFRVTTRLRAEITFRQVLNKVRERVSR